MTPPEGIEVDGTFIPGGTIVQVPTYTMFRGKSQFGECFGDPGFGNSTVVIPLVRFLTCGGKTDERLFPQATEFIPDRWTTRPDMAKDPAAFVPFGTGKHSNPHVLRLSISAT